MVIATGSSGPFPGKCSLESSSSELIKLYNDFTKEVAKAENIVIVGGGAVGVEMAGDIAGDYPGEKKVVHALLMLLYSNFNFVQRIFFSLY